MRQEIKQRLLKFETIHGLYFVPLGAIIIFVAVFYLEYILQAIGALVGLYAIIEGLRKIVYNPIKKEALKVINREAYITKNLPPDTVTK